MMLVGGDTVVLVLVLDIVLLVVEDVVVLDSELLVVDEVVLLEVVDEGVDEVVDDVVLFEVLVDVDVDVVLTEVLVEVEDVVAEDDNTKLTINTSNCKILAILRPMFKCHLRGSYERSQVHSMA
mmetsp:Transcript_21886/g.49911  ORF Transcript_21886/g.49911 Transcript_21886/m.49911 type:complete len:124 (+) Transcript_21886:199-570(+)